MDRGRFTRRSLVAALGVSSFARVGAAQTPEATPGVSRYIPKLRIGVPLEPEVVLPDMATSMNAMWMSSLVFDAPMRWNVDGDVIPGLFVTTAHSRSSVLQLQPRNGSMFSSDTMVSAAHLANAVNALRNTRHAWRIQHVEDISELDESTLQITLKSADASFMASLSHPLFGLESNGLGTGPFIPVSRDGSRAVYRRNSLFWQVGRPHIESLEIIQIEDDSQRSLAMATGEIDVLPNVPLLDVPMLADEPTVYMVGGPGNRLCHLQLRLSEPVLANREVRQILSAAINRADLVSIATADQAEPTSTLFPEGIWTDDVDDVLHMDSANVRSELQSLGIPSDLRLHLLADNADATLANTAVVLQEQLANCGISLSITLLEGAELAAAIDARAYDLLVSYSEPWRDPHELVWPLLSSGGSLNWSGYSSVEVDTLLRAAIALSNTEFRIGRYSRLESIIQKDVPCIPLFRPYVWDAVRADFPGYAHLPPATSRGLMTLLPTDSA